jgi:hypothetical protein
MNDSRKKRKKDKKITFAHSAFFCGKGFSQQ